MGNTQSNTESQPPSSSPRDTAKRDVSATARAGEARQSPVGARKAPPRAPPPPTASLVSSSSGAASTSTSHAQAHATTVAASPKRQHTRARSATTPGLGGPSAKPASPAVHADREPSADAAMGNSESKARPQSRSSTVSPTTYTSASSPDKHSQPVAVPSSSSSTHTSTPNADVAHDDYPASGYAASPYGLPPANYSRPPRLPLPIEEEDYVPGSPIISPGDIVSPLDADEVEGGLPRRSSATSSALDDEGELLDVYGNDTALDALKVPTKIDWNGSGDKIYVTGTFCHWDRKMKLQRNHDGTKGFSTTIMLPPGTHHLKFLVDGEMVTSPELPTTVDWGNILVNYIEIVAQAPSLDDEGHDTAVPSEPRPIPGAAVSAGQVDSENEPAAEPATQLPATPADLPTASPQVPERINEKLSTSAARPVDIPLRGQDQKPRPAREEEPEEEPQPERKSTPAPPRTVIPRPKYTNEIPLFLAHIDLKEEDERFQRASRVVDHLPQPPTLPSFLAKSILNGTTPHKDDASVLIMPNHTMLNHLATSSIKHGVLATSGTTRYKRKFLTTILYKPTSDDG